MWLPTWIHDNAIEKTTYDFMEHVIDHRVVIAFKDREYHLGNFGDPVWISRCAKIIQSLPRHDLATMHSYTTQSFRIVTQYIRQGKEALVKVLEENLKPYDWGDIFYYFIHDTKMPWNHFMDESIVKSVKKLIDEKEEARRHVIPKQTEVNSHFKYYANEIKKKKYTRWFKPILFQCIESYTLRNHDGLIFYPQARRKYKTITSLSSFIQRIPKLTVNQWEGLLKDFISDFDNLFNKMPLTTKPFLLYRGDTGYGLSGYVSTTLDAKTAKRFAIRRNGKKKNVLRIEIGPGSGNLLPLLTVSRYNEQEILWNRT